jgi:hypothetical protein
VLFELPTASEWWDGIDRFERGVLAKPGGPPPKPHPGYRAMWEWQRAQGKCFRDFDLLLSAYKAATGITVDVEP